MAKISEDAIMSALIKHGIAATEAAKVINLAKQQDEDEKEPKQPRTKKDFIVVINDPDGVVPDGLTCWFIQKEDTYLHMEGGSLCINNAPREWGDLEVEKILQYVTGEVMRNDRIRAKKGPFTCLGDVIEHAPAKLMKSRGLNVKTKVPVALVPVSVHHAWQKTTEELNKELDIKNVEK